MGEFNTWKWLVMTPKGDFFISVIGSCTQAESSQKVWKLFKMLDLGISGLLMRNYVPGSSDMVGTLVEQKEPKDELGYDFLAARGLWEVCDRIPEYEAELVLLNEDLQLN